MTAFCNALGERAVVNSSASVLPVNAGRAARAVSRNLNGNPLMPRFLQTFAARTYRLTRDTVVFSDRSMLLEPGDGNSMGGRYDQHVIHQSEYDHRAAGLHQQRDDDALCWKTPEGRQSAVLSAVTCQASCKYAVVLISFLMWRPERAHFHGALGTTRRDDQPQGRLLNPSSMLIWR